jgi:tetratricopeptide (TPR) repeat protein
MQNSAFISYRRSVSSFIARAVFQDLRTHQIDAFMDVESINAGQFDTIILNQIAARPYFLLILTPGTLERCADPGDWLLREINHAVSLRREIVSLVTVNFNFDDCKKFLPAPLNTELPRWNAVSIPHDYFDAAMDKLRTRFLKPIKLSVKSISPADRKVIEQKIEQIEAAPPVTERQLSAQASFERGVTHADPQAQIADFNEAIRLSPDYAEAYFQRGRVRYQHNEMKGALADFDAAIRLRPDDADLHNHRGNTRADVGDLQGALVDFGLAIQLNPNEPEYYNNRGTVRKACGDRKGALSDYDTAIALNDSFGEAYNNRGNLRRSLNDLKGALADFDKAVRLSTGNADAYYNRALVHYSQGNLTSAIADYDAALRINPKDVGALYNRAVARDERGDTRGAVADYKRFIELAPHDADVPKARTYLSYYQV